MATDLSDIVKSTYELAKIIGEFSLEGTGRETPLDRELRLRPLTHSRDTQAAHDWDNEDDLLFKMSDTYRDALVSSILEVAAANIKAGREADDIRIVYADPSRPASRKGKGKLVIEPNQPAYVERFITRYVREVLPGRVAAFKKYPKSMQAHPEDHFNIDVENFLKDLYTTTICPNVLEMRIKPAGDGRYEATENSEYVMVPALVALDIAGEKDAHRILGTRSLLNIRPPSLHARRPFLYGMNLSLQSRDCVTRKNRKNSTVCRAFLNWAGVPNQWEITKDDLISEAVMRNVYQSSPEKLEAVLRVAHTIAEFNPEHKGTYEELRRNIAKNAVRLGFSEGVVAMRNRLSEDAHTAAGELDFMLDHKEYGDQERDIVNMLQQHAMVASNYKSVFLPDLVRPRVKAKDGHPATEGLLVKQDQHFEGMERHLNQSKHWGLLGYFAHLGYEHKEKLFEHASKLGGLPGFSLIGFGTQEQLSARQWLENNQHRPYVRPNRVGRVYEFMGTELAYRAAKKVYGNLRDGAPFFTPITAVREVFGLVMRGKFFDLISDATDESDVPDRPVGKVSLKTPRRVEKAFLHMRPAYFQRQDQDLPWNIRQRFNLLRISAEDFTKDENNVPTLMAIGMLNSRLGAPYDANKFLEMGYNWCTKGTKQPTQDFEALSQYERSILKGMQGDEESRRSHLLAAFDLYKTHEHLEKAPYNTNFKELQRYALMHPMNYEMRHKVLVQAGKEGHYKPDELRIAAKHAQSEITTILAAKDGSLDAEVKGRLTKYRDSFTALANERPSLTELSRPARPAIAAPIGPAAPKDVVVVMNGKLAPQYTNGIRRNPEALPYVARQALEAPRRQTNGSNGYELDDLIIEFRKHYTPRK